MSRADDQAPLGDRPLIYDFGMNAGMNLPYYFAKGAKVVGVEANRSLCERVQDRFASDIEEGRLVVLNVALSEHEISGLQPFYIHRESDVLSQFARPEATDEFDEVRVETRTPASIVREFGDPLYIKIDVEHYDAAVLRNLFAAGIFPPEVSAEAHSVDVFALMVANGYNCFSLVDGDKVAKHYGSAWIQTPAGRRRYAFEYHSAGPFGEDIRGPWQDANTFLYTLAAEGLGWKDVHASKVAAPEPPRQAVPSSRPRRGMAVLRRCTTLGAKTLRQIVRRLLTISPPLPTETTGAETRDSG